ncbi:MAG: hypothetical protein ABSG76_16365 [Xanthobacteraceae bacterium]
MPVAVGLAFGAAVRRAIRCSFARRLQQKLIRRATMFGAHPDLMLPI